MADIAVLSGSLFTTSVENCRNLKVDLTLVNGSVVHNVLEYAKASGLCRRL